MRKNPRGGVRDKGESFSHPSRSAAQRKNPLKTEDSAAAPGVTTYKRFFPSCLTGLSVLFVAVGLVLSFPSYAMAAKSPAPAAESAAPVPVEANGPPAFSLKPNDHVLGAATAPVTIVEYASLTCPHCADFETQTLPSLKNDYIVPGKVRLIYRDFPLDQWSLKAAVLTQCVDKDFYFGLVEVLFKTQGTWTSSPNPLQALRQAGALAGVTPEKFESCMKDEALEKDIAATRLEAEEKFKVSSTPTFFLYGPKGQDTIKGSQPYATFKATIDRLLAGK